MSFFAPHEAIAAPLVTTNPASSIGNTEATLHGAVNSNGSYTNVWFEYGTSPSFGTTVGLQSVGTYSGTTNFSFHIFPLQSNTTYYFRAVAQNTNGTAQGSTASFTTSPGSAPQTQSVITTSSPSSPPSSQQSSGGSPFVTTRTASTISQTVALLNGSVHPNGELTNVWFEWGETISLGNSTLKQPLGNGTRFLDYSAVLSGLRPATTYFYRSVAENRFGKREGQIFSFLTTGTGATVISGSSPTPPPARANPARRAAVEETQVSMEVSLDTNEPRKGQEFNITVTYKNKSNLLLGGVLLSVRIPPDVLFISSTVSPKGEPDQVLIFDLGRLGSEGEGAVNINLKVKEDAAVGSILIFSVALEYLDPAGEDRKIDTFVVSRVKDGDNFAAAAFSNFPWWIFLLFLPVLILALIFIRLAKKKQRKEKMEDMMPLPVKKL